MESKQVERYLTIVEVSQKQAYIFSSKELSDNIKNSATIAGLMSFEYFEFVADWERKYNKDTSVSFSRNDNLVYSGGGHIILEFNSIDKAHAFISALTGNIHKNYPDIEVFSSTIPYSEDIPPGKNIEMLTEKLEIKKSKRKSAFHQGSFGVEQIDTKTLKPKRKEEDNDFKKESNEIISNIEKKTEQLLKPQKYNTVYKFSELGGTNDSSNFIAVVHIDGNAMGKRVKEFDLNHNNDSWEKYKKAINEFSVSIDEDFKSAYKSMVALVEKNLTEGRLNDLDLSKDNFPLRRVITAGDDICFVTEGRIGIECAVAFIKALSDPESGFKNKEDKQGYSACAGVAIVHQKYPFYKAYELAEMLCDNAKKFGAGLDEEHGHSGKNVSCIDWHIEFGEIGDTLKEIRSEYVSNDKVHMELRPYIVTATEEVLSRERTRRYENFKKLIRKMKKEKKEAGIDTGYARGKLKEMRGAIKEGESAARHYIAFNKLDEIGLDAYQDIYTDIDVSHIGEGKELERKTFVEVKVKKSSGEVSEEKHSLIFDAIEISDTFIDLEMEGEHED